MIEGYFSQKNIAEIWHHNHVATNRCAMHFLYLFHQRAEDVSPLLVLLRFSYPPEPCLRPFRSIFRFRNSTAMLRDLLDKLFILDVRLVGKLLMPQIQVKQASIELRIHRMSIHAKIDELGPHERHLRCVTLRRMFHG